MTGVNTPWYFAHGGIGDLMPNQPKTPARSVRVPDELWATARAVAEANGETVTDVLVRALDDYVNHHTPGARELSAGHATIRKLEHLVGEGLAERRAGRDGTWQYLPATGGVTELDL